MSIAIANPVKHDLLNRLDTLFPAGAILEIRSGAKPASVHDAPSGTLLCSITLPATPWAAAASGAKAKNGTWSGTAAAAGTAGHYRLKQSGDLGTTNTTDERIDGDIGMGSGDLSLDNTSIAVGQTVNVNTFQYAI